MPDKFAEVMEKIKASLGGGGGDSMQALPIPEIAANLKNQFGALGKAAGKDVEGHLNKAADIMKKSLTSGGKDLDNSMKLAVAELTKAAGGLGKSLGPAIASLVTAVLEVISKGNAVWADMYRGGVEGSMRTLTKTMLETAGLAKGPLGKALGGFLDNVITSMMFKFEEGLSWRQSKITAQAQLGGGKEQEAAVVASQGASKWWALGRQEGTQWSNAFSDAGFASIDDETVRHKMLGLGKQLGMDAGEAAKALEQYVSFGNSGSEATEKLEDNFRKLQKAAEGTNIPVKMLEKGIRDSAAAARFMNVDVAHVGSAMANLVKESANMSKFGVDMRMHSGTIAKDLATGGSKMSDAMHMYFGSKKGTEDTGMAGWAKSRFGAGTEVKATAGGGFEMGAGAASEKNMMQQRLDMMKQAMEDASAGASNDSEKLFMQMKAAKDMFGMSEETAIALATADKDNLQKLTDNPAMANKFKDTNTILAETQTMAAKSEQLQRMLVNIQMNALKEALRLPSHLKNLAEATSGDKKKGKAALGAATLENLQAFGKSFKEIGGIMRSVDPETFNMVGDAMRSAMDTLESTAEKTKGQAALVEAGFATKTAIPTKQAAGGPVDAGKLYNVGEGNKPELYMIPGSAGQIFSNETINKLAGSASVNTTNNASPVNLTVNISGVTKEQIMNQVMDSVRNSLM